MPSPERQRVLLHAFSTFAPGGPQLRFVALANAMGSAFKHVIVAMDGCLNAAERLGPGVDWQAVPVHNRRGGAMHNRGAFRKLLQQQQPDLLLTYNWGAIEWLAANTPCVVPQVHVEDGFRPDEQMAQLPRRLWARKLLFGLSRVRLVVPSRTLQGIASTLWRVPQRRLQLIPNGVATAAAVGMAAPADRPPIANGAPCRPPVVIGTVAALRAEKNIGRMLRAVAALRHRHDIKLVVVGDGPERATLQAMSAQLGLTDRVEFTGHMSSPTACLRRFDLFALSSDTEQLPISVLEAMAEGLPVVATAVGDVPQVFAQAGWSALAEPNDASFQQTLDKALADKRHWSAWGAAGKQLVAAAYSSEQMTAAWRTVFDGAWPATRPT